jgi:hypothetical protein
MKLILKCDVISDTILDRPLELKKNGRSFIFELDDQGRWSRLRVVSPVAPGAHFRWGIEPNTDSGEPNGASAKVHGKPDPELYESVVGDIQALESTLSLFFPLRSIDWRYPIIDVEFEDGDVRDPTWHSLGGLRVLPRTSAPLRPSEKEFVQIASVALGAHHLAVVESFWREGELHMDDERYINAFFSFYFVLEGLYGNRKTKNHHIEIEFLASNSLKGLIDDYMRAPAPDRYIRQIHDLLPKGKKLTPPDRETLIKLLVSIRGRLHHFSNNPAQPHGSPLNKHEYEGIAAFVRFLAHKSLVAELARVRAGGSQAS